MLHLTLEPEPDNFDADVRQKGLNYLRKHPNAVHYPDYWNKDEVVQQFRRAYRYVCAYSGLRDHTGGEIDHFIPQSKNKQLIYEWSNYRLAFSLINKTKGNRLCVDPVNITDGDILLNFIDGSVYPNPKLSKDYRDRLQDTIHILGLNKSQFLETRLSIIDDYNSGDISKNYLAKDSPFVAYCILSA